MIPVLVRLSGIPEDEKVNSITRAQRQALLHLFKAFPVRISGTRPIDEAIVASGGVCTKEINPRTMESKLVPGLYFAGEVLDVVHGRLQSADRVVYRLCCRKLSVKKERIMNGHYAIAIDGPSGAEKAALRVPPRPDSASYTWTPAQYTGQWASPHTAAALTGATNQPSRPSCRS